MKYMIVYEDEDEPIAMYVTPHVNLKGLNSLIHQAHQAVLFSERFEGLSNMEGAAELAGTMRGRQVVQMGKVVHWNSLPTFHRREVVQEYEGVAVRWYRRLVVRSLDLGWRGRFGEWVDVPTLNVQNFPTLDERNYLCRMLGGSYRTDHLWPFKFNGLVCESVLNRMGWSGIYSITQRSGNGVRSGKVGASIYPQKMVTYIKIVRLKGLPCGFI